MDVRPASVKITNGFIILNVFVWFALGFIIAFNLHPALPDQPFVKGIMAALSLIAATSLLTAYIFLQKRRRAAYLLMMAFLGISALLTFFDDFGWADLVVLAVSLIPLILLIKDRAWYLQPERQTTNESHL